MRKNSSLTRPKPGWPSVITNIGSCVTIRSPKAPSNSFVKLCPVTARCFRLSAQSPGGKGTGIRALATGNKPWPWNPRNAELLSNAAFTYALLRQFPTALKLYDRALDLVPNDPDLMAIKATIYQAQGRLDE